MLPRSLAPGAAHLFSDRWTVTLEAWDFPRWAAWAAPSTDNRIVTKPIAAVSWAGRPFYEHWVSIDLAVLFDAYSRSRLR